MQPIVTSADVNVVKTGPASVPAGTNVTYTVTVTNAGPSDAAGVSLADTLPPGTTFASETQSTGPTFTCTTPAVGATGTITCTIATLPAGASATFTIVLSVSPIAKGAITNTSSVTTTTPDPNPANNTSTATFVPVASIPALSPLTFVLLGITLAAVGFLVLRRRFSAIR